MTGKELERLEAETKDKSEQACTMLGSYFNYMRDTVKGLSLRELSRISGISIALISSFEGGEKLPRIETLIKLMIALGIPFNEVFGHKLAGLEFTHNPNQSKKGTEDNPLRQFLSAQGYNKDEIKDIIRYTDFIKYSRN